MNEHVVACVDGSPFTQGVVDAASWAARQLDAPLVFVHLLDHAHARRPTDLSGSIGLGAQESLLAELATMDARRSKLAMEYGRLVLEGAQVRAAELGVSSSSTKQLHGQLVERLSEADSEIRLVVLGKRGETAHHAADHLGSNLERVIRALHRPILVVPAAFRPPEQVMLAFDGSATMSKAINLIARSPLVVGTTIHVVQVGDPDATHRTAQEHAVAELTAAGFSTTSVIVPGQPEHALRGYCETHGVGLIIMGAYGHSRIRQLLVGSTTTAMIRSAEVPLLLMR